MPDAVYFDHVQLIDGRYAEVCDAVARAAIRNGTFFLGITTTELTDGIGTNPIMIAGESVTAKNGDITAYGRKEFVYTSADSRWHELGSPVLNVEVHNGVLEFTRS